MVTHRDLAEAQSFSRRRLVAAFVSGESGPETESLRPGRVLVGGLVLAGLVVTGMAVRHEIVDHGFVSRQRGRYRQVAAVPATVVLAR